MLRPNHTRLLAAALIASTQGCTYLVWRPACEDRAVQPQLAGVVRNYPNPGDRAMVVRYRAIGDGTNVDLVVPLSADLKPLPPFAAPAGVSVVRFDDESTYASTQVQIPHPGVSVVRFDDESTPDDNIAGGLSQFQLSMIRGQAVNIASDRPELARHLNARDFTPVAARYIAYRSEGTPTHPDTATVLAFRIDAAGEVVPIAFDPGKSPHPQIHLSAGDRVFVVPTTVARPPGDQGRDQVVAVALTPLTLAGDTALLGIGIGAGAVVLGAIILASPVLIVIAAEDKAHPAPPSPTQTQPPQTQPAQTQPVSPEPVPTTRAELPATTEIPILFDGPATTRP